jgi:hypothetical protein
VTYNRIKWQNLAAGATPLNATNLNVMDAALESQDSRITTTEAQGGVVWLRRSIVARGYVRLRREQRHVVGPGDGDNPSCCRRAERLGDGPCGRGESQRSSGPQRVPRMQARRSGHRGHVPGVHDDRGRGHHR